MEPAKAPESWFDRNFQSIVMGLMLCIIAAMSVLWLGERNRRIDAETSLRETQMLLIATQSVLEQGLYMLPCGENPAAQDERYEREATGLPDEDHK